MKQEMATYIQALQRLGRIRQKLKDLNSDGVKDIDHVIEAVVREMSENKL
jgi:hypothetical protein